MSVAVSIARGHDASYPFKTTGTAESPVITGQCGAGYYLSVVEKGGQPAGPRRFGFEWAHRPASKGRVIAGFPEIAIAQFSSRRAQITKTPLAVADLSEKDGGHAPGQREQASRGRFANAMTRAQRGPARWTSLRCCAAGNGPRVWPSLRRCATSHEPSGIAPRRNGTDRDAPRHTRRTRAHVCAARVARRTHARARTCGHGRRSRAGAGVTSRPLRCSAPASGNYRRSYTRARLEAR